MQTQRATQRLAPTQAIGRLVAYHLPQDVPAVTKRRDARLTGQPRPEPDQSDYCGRGPYVH